MKVVIGYLDKSICELVLTPEDKILYKGNKNVAINIYKEHKKPEESNKEFLMRLPKILHSYVWANLED